MSSTQAVAPAAGPAAVLGRLSTLDRFLPLWIFAAMGLGLVLGRLFPGLGALLDRVQVVGVSVPIGIGLLWMMYPVLAKVRYESIGAHVGNRRFKRGVVVDLRSWQVFGAEQVPILVRFEPQFVTAGR